MDPADADAAAVLITLPVTPILRALQNKTFKFLFRGVGINFRLPELFLYKTKKMVYNTDGIILFIISRNGITR